MKEGSQRALGQKKGKKRKETWIKKKSRSYGSASERLWGIRKVEKESRPGKEGIDKIKCREFQRGKTKNQKGH